MTSSLAPFLVKGKTAIVTGAGSGMQLNLVQYIPHVLTTEQASIFALLLFCSREAAMSSLPTLACVQRPKQ